MGPTEYSNVYVATSNVKRPQTYGASGPANHRVETIHTRQRIGLVGINGVQEMSRIPAREKQHICLAFGGQILSQTYCGCISNRVEKGNGGPK